jgi:Rrf2 family protein
MLSNSQFSMAIHVLTVLAYRDGEVIGSDDLAVGVGTNPSFLRSLIGRLRAAGLVETQQGKGGGTVLARDPASINLSDVYQAVEVGPMLKTHECNQDVGCPVAAGMDSMLSGVNGRIEGAIASELSGVTLADLVEQYVGVGV